VCFVSVLNDLFRLLQCKLSRWAHTPVLPKFNTVLGISQTCNHCNYYIWMEYNQFYSFNQNLHYYKYHFLAHHPPLPPRFHPLQNLPQSMYNKQQLGTSSLNMASRDYIQRFDYMLRDLLPCNSRDFYQYYLPIESKFQLASIWMATVVQNLAIHGVIYHLHRCIWSHLLIVQLVLHQGVLQQWL